MLKPTAKFETSHLKLLRITIIVGHYFIPIGFLILNNGQMPPGGRSWKSKFFQKLESLVDPALGLTALRQNGIWIDGYKLQIYSIFNGPPYVFWHERVFFSQFLSDVNNFLQLKTTRNIFGTNGWWVAERSILDPTIQWAADLTLQYFA